MRCRLGFPLSKTPNMAIERTLAPCRVCFELCILDLFEASSTRAFLSILSALCFSFGICSISAHEMMVSGRVNGGQMME